MFNLRITGGEQIEIASEEAEKIKSILLQEDTPEFIQVQGQPIKSSRIVGVFKQVGQYSSHQKEEEKENKWTDEELKEFEQELSQYKDFTDYLVSKGAWVVNDYYPEGAVKNPQLYTEMEDKRIALSSLRRRREIAKEKEEEALDNLISEA